MNLKSNPTMQYSQYMAAYWLSQDPVSAMSYNPTYLISNVNVSLMLLMSSLLHYGAPQL